MPDPVYISGRSARESYGSDIPKSMKWWERICRGREEELSRQRRGLGQRKRKA